MTIFIHVKFLNMMLSWLYNIPSYSMCVIFGEERIAWLIFIAKMKVPCLVRHENVITREFSVRFILYFLHINYSFDCNVSLVPHSYERNVRMRHGYRKLKILFQSTMEVLPNALKIVTFSSIKTVL